MEKLFIIENIWLNMQQGDFVTVDNEHYLVISTDIKHDRSNSHFLVRKLENN